MNFFVENIGTIAVLLAVFALVAFLVAKLIRDKREGKSHCSCGCASCPMSKSCSDKNSF